jgi:hypothetical protein
MTFRNMVWYYRKELSKIGRRKGTTIREAGFKPNETATLKRQGILEVSYKTKHIRLDNGKIRNMTVKVYSLTEKAKAELLRQSEIPDISEKTQPILKEMAVSEN